MQFWKVLREPMQGNNHAPQLAEPHHEGGPGKLDSLLRCIPPITTPEQIERQFERMDQADRRRIWSRCAKYSIHCANMLWSLGGR